MKKCNIIDCKNPAKYLIVGQTFVDGGWEGLYSCGIHIHHFKSDVLFVDRFIRKLKE